MKNLLFWVTLIIWLLGIIKIVVSDDGDDEETEVDTTNGRGDCDCELEVYRPEQESGFIKSPNYPHFLGCNGKCTYVILPHPNTSVTLYTAQYEVSSYATLEIFSLLKSGDSKILIPHAKLTRPRSYYYSSSEEMFPTFVSAKNAGFEIHFRSLSEDYYSSFKISFDRYYDYGEVCDYPIVEVGKEEVIVQNDHFFRSASGCVYRLKPKREEIGDEEGEMMITISGSTENMIALRIPDRAGIRRDTTQFTTPAILLASAHDTQIFSHKSTRTDGIYKFSKITAKLIGKSCACGPREHLIESENLTSITLHSPGYPDLYCPSRECKTLIYPVDNHFEEDKIGLFDISIKGAFGSNDLLEIKNDARTFYKSPKNSANGNMVHERFVIKQQGLGVHWNSDKSYSRRLFEINITQIMILPECSCSLFKDKEVTKARQSEFVFPKNCTFIYCFFTFKSPHYYEKSWSLEFNVKNALDRDTVVINDDKHTENYGGEILHKTRRFGVSDSCDFTFFRDNLESEQDTELFLNWDNKGTSDTCDGLGEYWVRKDQEVILTSPGYPKNYADDQRCEFYIDSEESDIRLVLSIDEISLENFHDHIYIYDGNSTDSPLLKEYTAHVEHEILNITQLPITILFKTDQSTNDRGFHITIKVLPILNIAETISYTSTFILIALVLLLICAVLLGLYMIKLRRESLQAEKRREEARAEQLASSNPGIALTPTNQNSRIYLDSIF